MGSAYHECQKLPPDEEISDSSDVYDRQWSYSISFRRRSASLQITALRVRIQGKNRIFFLTGQNFRKLSIRCFFVFRNLSCLITFKERSQDSKVASYEKKPSLLCRKTKRPFWHSYHPRKMVFGCTWRHRANLTPNGTDREIFRHRPNTTCPVQNLSTVASHWSKKNLKR